WAASVVLDGRVDDWAGVSASVTDPKGDAPVDTDIVAVYAQRDATRFYFRIDADIRLDTGGPVNAAPVVSAGGDQSLTLPASATLHGSASDDGLPNPPAALTLTWTTPVAPAAVTFGDAHAAQTTATFTQAGVYTLRLSASDGELSASSDAQVTVTDAVQALSLAPVGDRNILVGTHFRAPLSATSSTPGALTFLLDMGPPGASIGAGPSVQWTPTAAELGPHAFTASVSDGLGQSAATSFTVNVVYTNHPPQMAAQPDAVLAAGDPLTRTLSATDPDVADTLTFALVSGPAGMTLSGATLAWSTTGVAPGNYPVTVRVSDPAGLSDTRQFMVTLTPPAPAPVANDDAYSVHLGETLSVAAPGVLANDVDPAGGSLRAHKLTDPGKGTLNAFNADGSFNYTAPSVPAGHPFLPVMKWSNGQQADGDATPVVADVFANGKPVVFASRAGINQGGVTAIDGATGTTLWTVAGELPAPYAGCYIPQDNLPQNQTADDVAVGDIDDSGIPALVTIAYCNSDNAQGTRMIALNARTGAVKWLTPPLGALIPGSGGVYFHMTYGVTPAIARLRAGETPSVLFKAQFDDYLDSAQTVRKCDQFQTNSGLYSCTGVLVLDGADGSVRQRMIAPNDNFGRDNRGSGHLMVAALSGSGPPNIIANGAVWDVDGNLLSNRLGTAARSIALAKLDDSGQLSIISYEVGASSFIVARHGDGTVLWKTPIDSTAVNGLLSVADLDGDGSPDIMASAEGNLYVYDAHGQVKWVHRYANASNLRTIDTGKRPAAFDLDGDGIAEVIVPTVSGLEFNDGKTGKTKAIVPWPDLGVTNEPAFDNARVINAIVADIDGSGHASIVLVFPSHYYGATQYVVAIKSANDDWRPAPTVFNQFSYHVANVDNIGHIPLVEANNFAVPRTNVFGTQAQTQDPIDPRVFQATSFTYTAANGTLSSQPATVAIDIRPQNSPPVFTSIAPTAYVPYALTYAAHATDPDPGDTITYSLALGGGNGGPYCTVDGSSGLVTCVSLDSDDQYFTVVATDSQGAAAYQSVHVVQSAGSAIVPSVVGELQADAATTLMGAGFALGNVNAIDSTAPSGQVLSQSPSGGATALLGEAVAVTVSHGPAPIAVPAVVGLGLPVASSMLAGLGFTPAPVYAFSGVASIGTVLAQTPAAGTSLAPIPANPVGVTVSIGSEPTGSTLTQIIVAPAETAALAGKTATFTNRAIYSDHSARDFTHVTTWSSSDTSVATIDSGGVAHALHAGTTTIAAAVGAVAGNATLHVSAPVPGDATLPVALITAPTGGSEVTGITPIIGTATDANFVRYELAIAPSTDTTFTTIGQGAAPVSNG
ncbi:MAG: PASTA domain-containing protein, partial [Casimicrobiaceae bacterium]